jgi:hypothetical protein
MVNKAKATSSESKPSGFGPSHGSPHSFAACPHTPLHRLVLVYLGILEIFPGELLVGAELLICLVLFGSTDVCLIVSRVRENVIRFLALFDHCHRPGRQILELLFLRGGFRSDDSKSGSHEHALSVLRGALRAGAADQQCCAASGDAGEEEACCWFHR